ncbi:hypothetical protein KPH14_012200 [Odynerus spinipes]|uniref:Uncharacterized protein n=1 Tax=Odynerus spinipes TaxID=1348599 RepID=A0AAD9RG51_9HYME|nr:hypothetical protein KPH14_012200 [Odynerus spinipes]
MDPDNAGLRGDLGVKVLTRRHLFVQMQQQKLLNFEEKLNYFESHFLSCKGRTETQINNFKQKFSHFKSEMNRRWLKACRKEELFLKNNKFWLDRTFEIPLVTQSRSGRPRKLFEESSGRSKRRKTEDIRTTIDEEVIIHAAKLKLQTSGKRYASQILNQITNSPSRARKYKRAYSQVKQHKNVQLTPLQALAMFVEADLTRRQYEIIRRTNKRHYPCYSVLQTVKQECYPPKEFYRVTSTCVETNLQTLVDHTVTRLCKYLKEVLITMNCYKKKSAAVMSY